MDRPSNVMKPDELRKWISDRISYYNQHPELVTNVKNTRGAIVGTMKRYQEVDSIRKVALAYLFCGDGADPISTTSLGESDVMALRDWIDATKVVDSWLPQQYFYDEMRFLCNHAAGLFKGKQRDKIVEVKQES